MRLLLKTKRKKKNKIILNDIEKPVRHLTDRLFRLIICTQKDAIRISFKIYGWHPCSKIAFPKFQTLEKFYWTLRLITAN